MQDYDHDFYRNLTLAYYYVDNGSDLGNSTDSNLTTTTLSPTTTGNQENVTSIPIENPEQNLQERNELQVPEVSGDHLGTVDGVVVWLRYIHAVVVPILIFLFHKDLRKKAEVILCCWRPNSVESKKSAKENRPISAFMHHKRREWEKKQRKFLKTVTNYNVPVLFATSEGLFLRLIDDNFGPSVKKEKSAAAENEETLDDSLRNQWSIEPRFVMENCDLQLPMSATRGRQTVENSAENSNFGTTVTVIVGKKEPNLKSSLKKPKTTEPEDEGFIDASPHSISKKVVHFDTEIEEIPTLEPKQSRNYLPPLKESENSPSKKSLSRDRKKHRNR